MSQELQAKSEEAETIEHLRRRIAELEVENTDLKTTARHTVDRLDETLGRLGDHVAVYDGNWRYVYLNAAAAQTLGQSAEALLGRCIWTVFPEAVGNQYYEELHRAKNKGETIRSEHYYPPMDRWFLNHIYPSGDGVAVFSTDITEAKRAQEKANESNARFAALVEASPLAISVLSVDGIVQLWNPAAERMFGWTAEEVEGRYLPAVPEDKQHEFRDNLRATLAGDPLPVKQTRRKRKDGEFIDVALWSAPLRKADGTPSAALWIVADETDQRRHELELAAMQESLTFAMRGAQMGYWNRDMKTQVVYWSPELEEIFGLTEGSFAGHERDFFSFVHKDDLPVLAEAVQDSLRTGREYSVEFRFIRVDGSTGWMDGRGRATLDSEGNAIRIDGLGIDITDRKKAQANIQESERRFRFLSETLPVIAWSATADGTMDFINRRYYEYSGYDASTPPNQAWALVVHPEDRPTAYENYQSAVENGKAWSQEIRLRRRDGEFRWHLTRFEPFRDEYGTILRWFGSGTDIHDQKEAKAELERRVQERTKELMLANGELEGFTYSVSHDLRAPLRAISSTSTILMQELRGELEGQHLELLERQAHNAKRLGILIDELLKLSRVSRQELVRSYFDLSTVAAEIVAELSTREWPGEIQFEIEPELITLGDPKLVRFVLLNLLENACKFSPAGGTVRLGRTGEAFFVSDQGVGFDMAYADKLFQPFGRLVTEAEFPGTGIGLANAHRIVQRHGGRIWPESKPGEGTTFFFTLH